MDESFSLVKNWPRPVQGFANDVTNCFFDSTIIDIIHYRLITKAFVVYSTCPCFHAKGAMMAEGLLLE